MYFVRAPGTDLHCPPPGANNSNNYGLMLLLGDTLNMCSYIPGTTEGLAIGLSLGYAYRAFVLTSHYTCSSTAQSAHAIQISNMKWRIVTLIYHVPLRVQTLNHNRDKQPRSYCIRIMQRAASWLAHEGINTFDPMQVWEHSFAENGDHTKYKHAP